MSQRNQVVAHRQAVEVVEQIEKLLQTLKDKIAELGPDEYLPSAHKRSLAARSDVPTAFGKATCADRPLRSYPPSQPIVDPNLGTL
jgi:hypothetical protein